MKKATPRTMDAFLKQLERENKTLAEWAREKELPLVQVYNVTSGRNLGRRGVARDILIAMGVTPPAMFSGTRKAA